MLVRSLTRTSKRVENIGMLLGIVLIFASGLFGASLNINIGRGMAEIDLPTEGFRFYLSQLTPHAYAVNGYLQLMIKGSDLVDIWPNILVLLGFAVVFFLVAIWRFKFE